MRIFETRFDLLLIMRGVDLMVTNLSPMTFHTQGHLLIGYQSVHRTKLPIYLVHYRLRIFWNVHYATHIKICFSAKASSEGCSWELGY